MLLFDLQTPNKPSVIKFELGDKQEDRSPQGFLLCYLKALCEREVTPILTLNFETQTLTHMQAPYAQRQTQSQSSEMFR